MKITKTTAIKIHTNCIINTQLLIETKKAINTNFLLLKSISFIKDHKKIYKLFSVKISTLNLSKKLTKFMKNTTKTSHKQSVNFNF